MRHLTAVGDPNYDLNAFKPDPLGRITLHGGGGGKAPEAPPPPPPAPPPAEVQSPDTEQMIKDKKAKAKMLPSNPETFLTGTGGVDPNTLDLGKNVLLGS